MAVAFLYRTLRISSGVMRPEGLFPPLPSDPGLLVFMLGAGEADGRCSLFYTPANEELTGYECARFCD